MSRVISVALSPNTEVEDTLNALFFLFQPWNYRKGEYVKKLENYFLSHFGFLNCFAFNSGRSCLLAIFSAIDLTVGDEVIVQAYTCNAVINPILKMGATPIYVDIKSDLNIDIIKIEAKITPKTKAIIAQHTFGMPCDLIEIKKMCERHNVLLIEDCAHAIGAKYDKKYCGSFGDFSFFSFGRDKVISSVYGGMLVVNNENFKESVRLFKESVCCPTKRWILKQLLHPIITNLFVLPFYSSKIGRGVLAYSLNYNILSKSVTEEENNGSLPDYFPQSMPNALAYLALKQVMKLERYNLWRKGVVEFYKLELGYISGAAYGEIDSLKEPIYMRFPLILSESEGLIELMKSNNIYLNDGWRESPIVPPKTDIMKMHYEEGSCPVAEIVCQKVVCLPTHIRLTNDDLKRIVELIRQYLGNK